VLDANDVTSEAPLVLTLTPHDIADLADELTAYQAHFAPLFQRREQRAWADVYLRGLACCSRMSHARMWRRWRCAYVARGRRPTAANS